MTVSDRELALRAIDLEFQREVLDKLVRLETKMDGLVGNGQPGRMKLVEDKVAVLERNDLRNSVHNRLVNGAMSAAISVTIALHKYWFK
ncbi:MAG: hypothetical protein WCA49_14455 [Candidatus Sulfotelmatobacter sp.]